MRIVISWQWLVFYAYFPVYFLDDSGCKCGCLASGYSEPLSEMIGHWSVLIPNDGHCLRSPSPGAGARQQTVRANYQLHTRQTETRTRDNFRRHHPAMPCSWSAKCVIWGYFSPCIIKFDNMGSPGDQLNPAHLSIYLFHHFRRVPLETTKGSRQCLQNMQPGSYLTLDRRSRSRRKGRNQKQGTYFLWTKANSKVVFSCL